MQSVLAIQAPSGFQTGDNERRRNDILWGEVDFVAGKLCIRPLRWNNEFREYKFDNDTAPSRFQVPGREAFAYELLGKTGARGAVARADAPNAVPAPEGWEIIDARRLAEMTAERPSATGSTGGFRAGRWQRRRGCGRAG